MNASTGQVPQNCGDTANTGNILDIAYDFHLGNGNNGNVYAINNQKDPTRSQTFAYDQLNRLLSAQNAGTNCATMALGGKTEYWGNSYTYDAWGNLLNKTVTKCGAENMALTADAHNWVHATSGTDYAYDAAGNMTFNATAPALTYSYDQENRLTGAGGYTYTYDADGNRVKKANGTGAASGTLYWYMTPGIVAESDLAGAIKSEYVFFNGERIARRDGASLPGTAVYYFSDHLKTADIVTNNAGVVLNDSDYYPWGGEIQILANDSNRYKFTGKERDSESGLDYFGARYYSNGLGRWTSADWSSIPTPVPYAVFDDPQSLNLYSYVRNIPTTAIDKDGHENLKPQDWGHPGWTKCDTEQCRKCDREIGGPIFLGLAILAAPAVIEFGGWAYGVGYMSLPVTAPIIGGAIEGLTPGPTGTLTVAEKSLLRAAEQDTGARLAAQQGLRLVEGSHAGHDFVAIGQNGVKTTWDATGQPGTYKNWSSQRDNFFTKILEHVDLKSVDRVAIDLKGASKEQIKEVKKFVKSLTKAQQQKITYVN